MKLYAFAVFDAAAGLYGVPMFLNSKGVAVRTFMDECNNPQSSINKHAADYTLFQIGEYDDNTGELTPITPLSCGNAVEFINKE